MGNNPPSVLQKGELNTMKNITNEELVIAGILQEIGKDVVFPLLDVGGGSGKIASLAYPDKKVHHVDPLSFSDDDFPLPHSHTREQGDFFEFSPPVQMNYFPTLLFCHSLQYLDDGGIDRLTRRIEELSPENIIIVINQNTGILGDMLHLFSQNNWQENGEKHHNDFPPSQYIETKRIPFVGVFYPGDIVNSAKTLVRLLLDTHFTQDQFPSIADTIRKNNADKEFSVEQWVIVYQKTIQ